MKTGKDGAFFGAFGGGKLGCYRRVEREIVAAVAADNVVFELLLQLL